MKLNKLFGVKSITNLIYGLLLMLPFVSVLSRTIYVQANPNAKDSYYGETINEEKQEQVVNGQMVVGDKYQLNAYQYKQDMVGLNFNTLYVYNVTANNTYYEGVKILSFYNTGSQVYVYLRNESYSELANYTLSNITCTFWFTSFRTEEYSNYILNNCVTHITYNNYSYLDNAFEYSLKTFTEDNDVDSIDFFGWFTNLFLNQDNQHNQIYLGFANWYMNYTLLVSAGYLLFFALLWFINYVRKILEKSSYHDFGGF